MGLDQYAYAIKPKGNPKKKEQVEIAYWRKHNRLQGWMESLWLGKGGEGEFNCVDVEITEDDLDNLEEAINNKDLPETQGFFFGGDSYEDYEGENGYKKDDEEFIKNAREELKKGNLVFYSSWW